MSAYFTVFYGYTGLIYHFLVNTLVGLDAVWLLTVQK